MKKKLSELAPGDVFREYGIRFKVQVTPDLSFPTSRGRRETYDPRREIVDVFRVEVITAPLTRWLADEALHIISRDEAGDEQRWHLGIDEDSLLVVLKRLDGEPSETSYEAPTTLAALGEALADICHGRPV
jgi:hypothetical protein